MGFAEYAELLELRTDPYLIPSTVQHVHHVTFLSSSQILPDGMGKSNLPNQILPNTNVAKSNVRNLAQYQLLKNSIMSNELQNQTCRIKCYQTCMTIASRLQLQFSAFRTLFNRLNIPAAQYSVYIV